MLFNLGAHETVVILVTVAVLVAWPIAQLWLARRDARRAEKGDR